MYEAPSTRYETCPYRRCGRSGPLLAATGEKLDKVRRLNAIAQGRSQTSRRCCGEP